jgi:hypothetical protein
MVFRGPCAVSSKENLYECNETNNGLQEMIVKGMIMNSKERNKPSSCHIVKACPNPN